MLRYEDEPKKVEARIKREPGPDEPKVKRGSAGTFDRRAYQREYMRKRRAAAKERAE